MSRKKVSSETKVSFVTELSAQQTFTTSQGSITISNKSRVSSARLLLSVLKPHTRLAVDLIRLVKRSKIGSRMRVLSDDPTHRFQIAALIVFLSGVDKALSLTLELAYIAGLVEWKWLKGRLKVEPGEVICAPGISAKIDKLSELGLNLSALKWLVDLRNQYIHECRIYAGYSFVFPDSPGKNYHLELKPHGPRITISQPPLVALGPQELKTYSSSLATHLARFLDKSGWKKAWLEVSKQINNLPINPGPEYTTFIQNEKDCSLDDCLDFVTSLNTRHIGEGLTLVGVGMRKRTGEK